MNARTTPPGKPQLHLAERYHNPYAEYNADMQDLFCHAMDRALGIQKASLEAVAQMQSNVIEMQKQACGPDPAFGSLFEMASQAFAAGLEIQLSWVNLMVASAKLGAESWFHLATMGMMAGAPADDPVSQALQMDEESVSFRAGAA
jgi:hypothetical protein